MIKYCKYCNKETSLKKLQRTETYPVKGENTTIEATVYVCEVCGQDAWIPEVDDENLDRAYAEYRKAHGLLNPDEIKSIREKYGLSQVAFARILGFGEKTIARYENGSLQDEAPNNLLLLVKNPESFMVLFQRNKCKLTQQEIAQVERKRMVLTLPNAVKYSAALKKMGYDFTFTSADSTLAGDNSYKEAAVS